MSFYELMERASQDVGMTFNEDKYNKFIKYMRLVQEWNEKVNLTAILDDEEFVKKHFIDCIKIFKSNEIKTIDDKILPKLFKCLIVLTISETKDTICSSSKAKNNFFKKG